MTLRRNVVWNEALQKASNLTPVCLPKFCLLSRRTTMPPSAPDHKSGGDGKGRSGDGQELMGLRKHQFEWHTFRHTYRSWLDETGAPMKVPQELMRQASIQTTMNVYGRAKTEIKRRANSQVAGLVFGPNSQHSSENTDVATLQSIAVVPNGGQRGLAGSDRIL